MVKRKHTRGSSHLIIPAKSCNRRKLDKASEQAAKILNVTEDILKSPLDEQRLFRFLELRNGLKVMLITDLRACEFEDSSDDDEDRGPACRDPQIDNFNEAVLGFKKPPCCGCAEHHRNIPHKKPIKVNCKECRSLSYISLTVGAGEHNDPPEASGLAHLCEHMVFTGSKKYPAARHLDDFITKNGGSSGWNGRTSGDYTLFDYDIMCYALRKSLEIFVSYFIEPLIPLERVDKELSVLESEFQNTKSFDLDRRAALFQSFGKTEHPVCRSGWGNRENLYLSPKALHRLLHGFFQKWYCSDNMTLVIMSPASLDELQDMVLETFGKLERRGTPLLSLASQPFPYATPAFRRIYRMVPTMDDDILYISWELPAAAVYNYEAKPAEYMAYYLGNECKNGLSYYLRKKFWVLGISAEPGNSHYDLSESSSMFYLGFPLTKLGLDNIENILEAVFSYIKYANCVGPLKWLFKESQLVSSLEFHFHRPEYFDAARHLVEDLRSYKPLNVLVGPYIPTKWEPKAVTEYMALLRPELANYMIMSKSFAEIADSEEPIHGTPYSVEAVSRKLIRKLENAPILPNFGVIPANPFITTNFCPVRPKESCQESSDSSSDRDCSSSDDSDADSTCEPNSKDFPTCILETDNLELWHKHVADEGAQADFFLEFASPLANQDTQCFALLEVWIELLKFRLKPAIAAATQAHMKFKISRGTNGVMLHIGGHSQKLGKVFTFFLEQFLKMESKLSLEGFEIAKEIVLKNYYNVLTSPLELHKKISRFVTSTPEYFETTMYSVLDSLQYEEYQKFSRDYMAKLLVFGLAQGNVLDSTFKRMGRKLVKTLQLKPVLPADFKVRRTRQMLTREIVIRVRSFDPDDTSFVVSNNYQTIDNNQTLEPDVGLRRACILSRIGDWMEEPAFNYLRVEKQLGYDVYVQNTSTMLTIGIRGDSSKFDAGEVQVEIDNFVRNFYEDEIKCLTQRKLRNYIERAGYAKEKACSEKNWAAISDGSYNFGRDAKLNETLDCLQVEDVRDFYKKFLLPGPDMRKVSIQIVGTEDNEFPVENREYPPGIYCKYYDEQGHRDPVERPRVFPLTFLSPRPKSARSSSTKAQNREKYYVTSLNYFVKFLFLYPKKLNSV